MQPDGKVNMFDNSTKWKMNIRELETKQPNGKMNISDNATQHKWIDCQTSDEDFIFLRFLFIQQSIKTLSNTQPT